MAFNQAAEPDELPQQYFDFIRNSQYENMYEMLSAQSQEMISQDDFIARNKNIYEGIEARNIIATIGQTSDQVDESAAVSKIVGYSVRLDTVAGEISYTNKAVFIKNEDKEYRMQWTTNTIFPNLNPADKVRVNTLPAKRGCIYDRRRGRFCRQSNHIDHR